ncbi:hypothetical protein [Tanticharoenia sakaeratensis]|uniref:Restriction endonuclease type IV Mrr domain-containing protein n=1 Tax=Tanticharoenia sakaeratensis NBRC 103193 TaxID=1231623 RepID=A0A0D6MPT6_9PROT|nr:hypothetical protein [Tanticharoenia sakaeratensis]GAN55283.1 hypothetical protein Tasa_042_001 [Tanticharoenia sakaeratensis NBRC 103193]GBQ25561.1 hypothetical protein AA103193_3125 [Tanticharoenia sakaeratensis NBRC 103193]
MYFSGLRKLIGSVEETRFYDVAILYLSAQKYRGLSIVDGTGDGGRDVLCSREDLRIQLSVRRDWENKINEEAASTAASGKSHLIYVTNRVISPRAEAAFLASRYKFSGKIECTIHDLNRITTALARPGRIKRAYEMVGATVVPTMHATSAEVAVSSLLLFGQEAFELREQIVDANVRAWLFKHPNSSENTLVDEVSRSLPGTSPVKAVASAVSRLRTSGRIVGPQSRVALSEAEFAQMQSAEDEFLLAREADVAAVAKATGLLREDAIHLLNLATETLLRGRDIAGGDADSESVRVFLAERGLSRQRTSIYKVLSECSIARHFQYANTIDQIFSTNTFDIYRALGSRTEITMVLDTSVALPMLFGLEFQVATSRYAVSATTLLEVCRSHEIAMMVPRAYVNEMASHGLRAFEFLDTYDALPEDLRPFLRGSGNAFLSHFSHIQSAMANAGGEISLTEFLRVFGLRRNASLRFVENRILSLLESHGITTGMSGYYDADIRRQIAKKKSPHESNHILDHDAAVCTSLINDSARGFILATWDKVLIEVVQGLARVYADSPARVTDFLSAIEGIDYDYDHSTELFTTLLHVDEQYVERFAQRLEALRTPTQAHKLRAHIEDIRLTRGETWLPDIDDLTYFLDASSSTETSSITEE